MCVSLDCLQNEKRCCRTNHAVLLVTNRDHALEKGMSIFSFTLAQYQSPHRQKIKFGFKNLT